MQLAAVALLVLAAAVRAEDECAPKPGEEPVNPDDCCKMEIVITDNVKQIAKTCTAKFPKPSVPPPAPGAKPDAAILNRHACVVECTFEEAKILTADKKLDKDAIIKFYTAAVGEVMKPAVTAAVNKCIDVKVDPSLECKSGAVEFRHCLRREAFFNCPSSIWTSNEACEGLKSKLTKCPEMPVVMVIKESAPK